MNERASRLWSTASVCALWCMLVAVAGAAVSASPSSPQTWTVVVYAHADHNLSYSLARDLAEMSRARIGNHLRVIVVADWDASRKDEQTGRPFPTGTEWLRIRGNQQAPLRILQQPEQDFDDPQVLRTVVQQALQRFPARRYGLILWDHGGGWENGFGGDEQNGTRDRDEAQPMSPATVAAALRASRFTRWEFIAFDTCLLAGAEVIAEFVDLAKVYLACAEIDFGDGWDYEATLSWLSANSTRSAQDFARAEVAQWNQHHLASQSDDDLLLRSHAAFDLAQWLRFTMQVRNLTRTIAREAAGSPATRLALARRLATTKPGYKLDPTQALHPRLRDFGQLLQQWEGIGGELGKSARNARQQLVRLQLGVANGALRQGQYGLHIEAALASVYGEESQRLARYRSTAQRWGTQSGWASFLQSYVRWDDETSPTIVADAQQLGESEEAEAEWEVEWSCGDPDVLYGSVRLLRQLSEEVWEDWGLLAHGEVTSGTNACVWNGQMVHVSDGQNFGAGTIELVVDAADTRASVYGMRARLKMLSGDEEEDGAVAPSVDGWLVFGAEDEKTGWFAYENDLGLLSFKRLQPGWMVEPQVVWSRQDDEADEGESGVTPQIPLIVPETGELGLTLLPAFNGMFETETFAFEITVMDVWGNVGVERVLVDPEALTRR